jgi:hypothetical protein
LTDIFCNFKDDEYININNRKIVNPNLIDEYLNKYYDIDINNNKYLRFGKGQLEKKDCSNTDILLFSSHRLVITDFEGLQYQKNIINKLFNIDNYNIFIKEQLLSYIDMYKDYDLIGIHIRRGDTKTLLRGSVPLYNFYEIIDTRYYDDKKYKFLISSDSDNETQIICNRYNKIFGTDKCINYNCRSQDTQKIESIQDAFITLILLSKCKIIYGSPSSYSNLAAFIGNISKITIKVDQTHNVLKHIKELRNMTFDLKKSNYNSNTIPPVLNKSIRNIKKSKNTEILTNNIDITKEFKKEIETLKIKKNIITKEINTLTNEKEIIMKEYKVLKYNRKNKKKSIDELVKNNNNLIKMNKDNDNKIIKLKNEHDKLLNEYNKKENILNKNKKNIQDKKKENILNKNKKNIQDKKKENIQNKKKENILNKNKKNIQDKKKENIQNKKKENIQNKKNIQDKKKENIQDK